MNTPPSSSPFRWLPLWAAVCLLAPAANGAEPLFELGFENGLAAGGSITGLVVSPQGGGGELETGEGKAYQLDGSSLLEVAVPSREVLSFGPDDEFTLRIRVRLERLGRSGALLSKGSGASYRLMVDPKGFVGFSYYSRGEWRPYQTTLLPLPQQEWAEVVAQYHGTEGLVTLLVDGKLAGRFPVEAPLQSRDATPLYIGGSPGADGAEPRGIIGAIDEVRIEPGLAYPAAAEAAPGGTVESTP